MGNLIPKLGSTTSQLAQSHVERGGGGGGVKSERRIVGQKFSCLISLLGFLVLFLNSSGLVEFY